MKKVISCVAFLLPVTCLHAQDIKDKIPENSLLAFYLRLVALLLLFSVAGYVIVTIIQKYINYQLRKKIIEHKVSESLATQLLSTDKKNHKKESVKMILLTTSLAVGILVASFIPTFDIYSAVIILVSLAAGYFFYYIYLKRSDS